MFKTHLLAAVVCASLAAPAAARPFTAKDLASLDRVSSPSISSDGRYVAYAVRSTDWDGNKGTNALQIIDLNGDPSKPLVLLSGEKGGPSPSWSRDGRWLYFISGKSGSAQVWRSNADGSVRQQLTAFPIDVAGFKLAPDLHTLVVAADVYPDCGTLACTKARDDAKAREKGSAIEVKSGTPRYFDTYLDDKFLALFRADLAQPGAPAEGALVARGFAADIPPEGDSDAFAISNDGRTVYFVSREPAVEPDSAQAFTRIYAAAEGAGAPRVLAGSAGTSLASPTVSPDGRQLAYLAMTAPIGTVGRTAVMLMDLRSGRTSRSRPRSRCRFQRARLVGGRPKPARDRTGAGAGAALSNRSSERPRREDRQRWRDQRLRQRSGNHRLHSRGARFSQQLFVQQGAGPARQLTHAGASISLKPRLAHPNNSSSPAGTARPSMAT